MVGIGMAVSAWPKVQRGSMPTVATDDLAAAVRAYEAAQAGLPEAQAEADRLVAEAKAEIVRTRQRLAAEIVKATEAGVRQVEIVRVTHLTRERIRQIVRAAGVEPD